MPPLVTVSTRHAPSEFGLVGVLPVMCIPAHLWVSVWGHCPWCCSSRFHDASCLY